jgi:glyoxylase-like metal-dependent hydrolase (beta-lactamase superfamily II)
MRVALFSWILFAVVCTAIAQDYGRVTTHKLADGVYLFTTTPYADVGFCGNVIAIIGRDSVLVFDSGAIPSTARTIVAEIAKLSHRPVRYLVNSHWHWDHWGGNEVFLARYPGLQIITHAKNMQMMQDVEPRWNAKGLSHDLPEFVHDFETRVTADRQKGIATDKLATEEARLRMDREFLSEKQVLKKTYPNKTFDDSLRLDLGGREVQIRHAHAITPGDTYVWLPKERILITGDILINPYPYAIGGTYPKEWIATLEHFVSTKPNLVVAGHGMPAPDLLQRNLTMMREIEGRVVAAKQSGRTLEQTSDTLSSRTADFAKMVGAETPEDFQNYFFAVFVKRAYRELDGDLGDVPDGLQ